MSSGSLPPSGSIMDLNHDILLEIFTMIIKEPGLEGTLLPLGRPLREAQAYSYVCREWRQVILHSPTIWGKLLQIDFVSHAISLKWLKEILRRSKMAVLWIEVLMQFPLDPYRQFTLPSTDPYYLFFINLLREHWNRTECLSIPATKFLEQDSELINIVCHPAPRLQRFTFVGPCQFRTLNSMPGTLFGNEAPHLQEFRSDFLLLSMKESWLSGLRTFKTTGQTLPSVKGETLLEALSLMPQLEEIVLGLRGVAYTSSASGNLSRTATRPRIMSFPHLKSVALYYPNSRLAVALLKRIIPSTPTLGFRFQFVMHPADFSSDQDFEELASIIKLVIDHHIHVAHGSYPLDDLEFRLVYDPPNGDGGYSIKHRSCGIHTFAKNCDEPFFFDIDIQWEDQTIPRAVLKRSEWPIFSDITSLSLRVICESYSFFFFLSRFPATTHLKIDVSSLQSIVIGPSNGSEYGLWLTPGVEDTSKILFPKLSTLEIRMRHQCTHYYDCNLTVAELLSDDISSILELISQRRGSSIPITSLQLLSCLFLKDKLFLQLGEVEGVEVTWREEPNDIDKCRCCPHAKSRVGGYHILY